jgi:von Willebrand factor type A domain
VKKRHTNSTFSLSFLDIMCCGFGATVLIVMLLHGQTLQKRDETHKDLKAEVERETKLKEFASAHLAELREQVEAIELEEGDLLVQAVKIRVKISEKQQENELAEQEAQQREKEIAAMKKEISSLEKARKKKEAQEAQKSSDEKQLGFDGEGKRQYLTGLKLGGDRTLILVDASASMLDETIVNIVRRKLMTDSIRRRSPKWLRVVRSLHWLVANLQPDKKFQVYYFNTNALPVVQGTERQWLNTSDPKQLDGSIAAVRRLAPNGGTSLINAFDVIRQMDPKPDSVLLLTDGLPTQGKSKHVSNTITGEQRLFLFNNAVKSLPVGVPINTLLFPIEGDPAAAYSYWGLAVNTHGSFITPSRDWP